MVTKRVNILGVPIDPVTSTEALDRIETFIASKLPHQVATVNPEFIMAAQDNQTFHEILQTTNLNIADGVGVRAAASFLATPIPAVVTGVDLLTDIARQGAQKGWGLYLVGGRPNVASMAAEALKKQFPSLRILGAEEGIRQGQGATNKEALIERIKHAKPDVLFVAFGAPKQDLFIAQHKAALEVPVMMGVGGSFDFLAGIVPRAPRWLRTIGLEWLWRLLLEPWRFPRIITATIRFPWRVFKSAMKTP